MPLTVEAIENAKPGIAAGGRATNKPYKMGDSGGLYLEVSPSGGKLWRLKYRFERKEKRLALGSYPKVSLLEARELRDKYRNLLAGGIDPGEYHKAEKANCLEEASLIAASRFMLDSEGALSIRLRNRLLTLSVAETAELRWFLDATRAVDEKAKSWC